MAGGARRMGRVREDKFNQELQRDSRRSGICAEWWCVTLVNLPEWPSHLSPQISEVTMRVARGVTKEWREAPTWRSVTVSLHQWRLRESCEFRTDNFVHAHQSDAWAECWLAFHVKFYVDNGRSQTTWLSYCTKFIPMSSRLTWWLSISRSFIHLCSHIHCHWPINPFISI